MDPEQGQKSEVDKFFEGLPSEETQGANIFEEVTPEKKPDEVVTPEKGDTPEDGGRKNRRHRRLEAQLQRERELRIAAEARAAGQREAGLANIPQSDDMPAEWVAMYGADENSQKAWTLQKKMLDDVAQRAREQTLAEIDERNEAAEAAEREYEELIESELETLEDEFNVDLTSDAPAARKARRELLELVQELSPKDEAGNVTGYADFAKTYELYESRKKEAKPDANARKELAGRAMERGVDPAPVEKQRTPGFWGWQKDLT